MVEDPTTIVTCKIKCLEIKLFTKFKRKLGKDTKVKETFILAYGFRSVILGQFSLFLALWLAAH